MTRILLAHVIPPTPPETPPEACLRYYSGFVCPTGLSTMSGETRQGTDMFPQFSSHHLSPGWNVRHLCVWSWLYWLRGNFIHQRLILLVQCISDRKSALQIADVFLMLLENQPKAIKNVIKKDPFTLRGCLDAIHSTNICLYICWPDAEFMTCVWGAPWQEALHPRQCLAGVDFTCLPDVNKLFLT